jgi:hypothetical protein
MGISRRKLWWWVRVLPPPGTLIWRLPGFIRPRCTAGATHRLAESYYGVALHFHKIACQPTIVISKDESQRLINAVTGEVKSGQNQLCYNATHRARGQVNYRFRLPFGGQRDGVHANQGGSFSLGSRPSVKNSPSLVRLMSSFRRSFKCIIFISLFALFAETYNPTIVPSPELSR